MKIHIANNRMVIVHPNLFGGLFVLPMPDNDWTPERFSYPGQHCIVNPFQSDEKWAIFDKGWVQYMVEGDWKCRLFLTYHGHQKICIYQNINNFNASIKECAPEYGLLSEFSQSIERAILTKCQEHQG